MSFPQEILDAIFGHFGQQSDASQTAIETDCLNRKTLASLCRVSKHFNAAVTPLLYRHVRLFNNDIRLFTRTILQNLGTRKLVKRLSAEFELPGTHEPDEVDEERRREVPGIAEEQWDYQRCLSETLSLLQMDSSFAGVGGADILVSNSMELNFDDKPEEDLTAVLLFVLPELQYLRVKLDPMTDWENPSSSGFWRCDMLLQTLRLPYSVQSQRDGRVNYGVQNLIPASLFHLEELVICNPFEEPGTIKSTYPPIVFCPLFEMQPFWGLPNIRTLILERAIWDGSPPLSGFISSSVEHLELLDTAIAPSKLPQILQHFPSLRSFKYVLADLFDLTSPEDPLLTRDMVDSAGIERIVRLCNPNLAEIVISTAEKGEAEERLAELGDLDASDSN